MATAFCGFCAGCASDIQSQDTAGHTAATTVSAASDKLSTPQVILNPGYQYGYDKTGATANTVDTSGATKLTSAQEEAYWVTNAYFATVSAGEKLPDAQTERAKTTFVGWMYARDGVVEMVETMPSKLEADLFLYAKWETESDGGGYVPTPDGSDATVNGKKMSKNPTPMAGVDEEYMITGATFNTGDTLVFTVGGNQITVSELDGASTGLSFSGGTVTVAKGGTFELYLKKVGSSWQLYGSRTITDDEVSIQGENAVAGNVYLAGNITGADFTWNDWNDSTGKHKALKANASGSSYTLTVKLTQNDNCKFVKYGGTSGSVWQGSLSGTGASNITYNGGPMDNMIIKTTGTYTFTVTVSGNSLAVSVTFSA